MSLVDNKYVFAIVGEISVCTQAAAKDDDVIGKTVFVAKEWPDKTVEHIDISIANAAAQTFIAVDADNVITVLYQPVEGFEDLSGFKRLDVNISNSNRAFRLEASAFPGVAKRVKLKIIMLLEKRA